MAMEIMEQRDGEWFFEPEGVTVKPPAGRAYVVSQKDFGHFRTDMNTGEYSEDLLPENSKPIRALLRFDITLDGEPVTKETLTGHVQVTVRWTAADYKIATEDGKEGLKLIIDYGQGWKPFTGPVDFISSAPKAGGTAILTILKNDWGDPRIGWAD
jgi:hypothetical protein